MVVVKTAFVLVLLFSQIIDGKPVDDLKKMEAKFSKSISDSINHLEKSSNETWNDCDKTCQHQKNLLKLFGEIAEVKDTFEQKMIN